ncbi:uncharacterized protein [Triticum aestivum]|uniref:uncharacterized protein isoform X2 n=1 Tax=Triticum aestivum TaxID=4565 RepID=UPI001D0329C2|nr:uncharacterized protein LOC123043651 isoform X2 [Triticum aestivum]
MEAPDPRAPALDLATEAIDATSGVHMGGGLLPAAAWRARARCGAEGEPGGSADVDRGGGVRAAAGRAGGGPVGAAGAGGRDGQAPRVAGRAAASWSRRATPSSAGASRAMPTTVAARSAPSTPPSTSLLH